ncbi:hypothetical protein [Paracoccus sp. MKU1]|uniref:hypothetical protein n=1 Tax=Paracoccus sp. MKU1 TaxID=1745182 RepID=UPI00071912EF|nr:hypothetical protein [Paracoccus sp. MKU1]KRW93128.1 hypothetical protein AQY21_26910 [Paracoccus sp. MKU1]
MSTIPFIEACFFSLTEGRLDLELRLKKHLRKLRCKRIPPDLLTPPVDVDAPDESPDMDLADFNGISAHDATRTLTHRTAFPDPPG